MKHIVMPNKEYQTLFVSGLAIYICIYILCRQKDEQKYGKIKKLKMNSIETLNDSEQRLLALLLVLG